jgi:hypothetical protein
VVWDGETLIGKQDFIQRLKAFLKDHAETMQPNDA